MSWKSGIGSLEESGIPDLISTPVTSGLGPHHTMHLGTVLNHVDDLHVDIIAAWPSAHQDSPEVHLDMVVQGTMVGGDIFAERTEGNIYLHLGRNAVHVGKSSCRWSFRCRVLAISLALASRSCSRNLSRSGSSFCFFCFFFFFFFLGCSASSSGSPDGPAADLFLTVSSGLAKELPGRTPSSGISGSGTSSFDLHLSFFFFFFLGGTTGSSSTGISVTSSSSSAWLRFFPCLGAVGDGSKVLAELPSAARSGKVVGRP